MAELNKDVEYAQRVSAIDAVTKSPEQRAQQVFNTIRDVNANFTNWDLLCFAGELLGLSVAAYTWLEKPAKETLKLLYSAHYFRGHDLGLYKEEFNALGVLEIAPIETPSEKQIGNSARQTEEHNGVGMPSVRSDGD